MKTTHITARVSNKLVDKMDDLSLVTGKKRTELVQLALQEFVERHELDEAELEVIRSARQRAMEKMGVEGLPDPLLGDSAQAA